MTVSNVGMLSDSDESTFLYLEENKEELSKFEAESWFNMIYYVETSIPETFFRFIQLKALSAYSNYIGKDTFHPQSLRIISIFNVMVQLLSLFLIYKILIKIKFNKNAAFWAVLFVAITLNFNVYLRHILPYENAYFLFIASFCLLVYSSNRLKFVILAGLLAATALTTYYGYFMFYFILLFYLFFNQTMKKKLLSVFLFLLPLFALIICYEWFSSRLDVSYLEHLSGYSSSIVQGSSAEGLVFVFKYFFFVEGFYGATLIFLSIVGVYFLLRTNNRQQVLMLLLFSSALLSFSVYVYFWGNMVFYGRILHMYYFLVILLLAAILDKISITFNMYLAVFFILQMYYLNKEMESIAYPRNVFFSFYENTKDMNFEYISELKCGSSFVGLPPNNEKKAAVQLVNFCFFYHYPNSFIKEYKAYKNPDNYIVINRKLHFMSHPFYTFEYCTIEGKQFFKDHPIFIQIFVKD